MGLACLKGADWWSGDPTCLWIPGLTCLSGPVEQNRDCMCVSPALLALGAQPCRVNIVQGCTGFGGMAGTAEFMQGWGAWPSEMELLQGCAGLGRA
jgi:hypothetical protein